MDSYDVIISPRALTQLNDYIDYIQYTLFNEQAAFDVWHDALETRDDLSGIAGSLRCCTHPRLKEYGYHIVNFKRHHYIMLYRIEGKYVYVEAIYHQLQDYENIFVNDMDIFH